MTDEAAGVSLNRSEWRRGRRRLDRVVLAVVTVAALWVGLRAPAVSPVNPAPPASVPAVITTPASAG